MPSDHLNARIDPGQFEPAIDVDAIVASPFNRRDLGDLTDLADSIRTHGVISPITVRRVDDSFELVVGERRWRASQLAGRDTIPAVVRDLTDEQALEIQLIENAARKDLHPLEEADTYAELLKLPGYTEERIADRTGQRLAHVRDRLRLARLRPAVRAMVLAGKIGIEGALLISRMPAVAELQEKAAAAVAEGKHENLLDEDKGQWVREARPMTVREVQQLLRADFMTRLDRATWPLDDAELVPAAGACTGCPKRTGNQPTLFAEIKSPDVCTDPTCFRGKTDAMFKQAADLAKLRGLKVLADKEAKAVLSGYVDHERGVTAVKHDAKLADVGDRLPFEVTGDHNSKKTWSTVLRGVPNAPPVVVARDPNTGAYRELVDKAAAIKAANAAGKLKKLKKPDPPKAGPSQAERDAERAQEELEQAARLRLLEELAQGKAPGAKADLAWWRIIARLVADRLTDGLIETTVRRGWREPPIAYVDTLASVAELRGLVVEILAGEVLRWPNADEAVAAVDDLCKLLGIDRAAHLAAAKAAAEAEEAVPEPPKKGRRRG